MARGTEREESEWGGATSQGGDSPRREEVSGPASIKRGEHAGGGAPVFEMTWPRAHGVPSLWLPPPPTTITHLELDDVAVAHNVVFALLPVLARRLENKQGEGRRQRREMRLRKFFIGTGGGIQAARTRPQARPAREPRWRRPPPHAG